MNSLSVRLGSKTRTIRVTQHAVDRYLERVGNMTQEAALEKIKGELEGADLSGKKDSHGAKYIYSGNKIIVIKVDDREGWKVITVLKLGQRISDTNLTYNVPRKG